MEKKLLTNLFLLLFAGGFLASCKAEHVNNPLPADEISLGKPQLLGFAKIKSEILKPYCIRYHSKYEDYEAVKIEARSVLASVEKNRMPKNEDPLSSQEKRLLRDWVLAGAPLEAIEPGQGESLPEFERVVIQPNYQDIKKYILNPHCIACHQPGGAGPRDFSTFEAMLDPDMDYLWDFEDPYNSEFVRIIVDPELPMPPRDSEFHPLDQEQVSAIIQWIADCRPEKEGGKGECF